MAPFVQGETVFVSPRGNNRAILDRQGRWQRIVPGRRPEFLPDNKPPRNYRRISGLDSMTAIG